MPVIFYHRYILAIMMFMGFVNMYAVRVNLNVAIGAMANNHTVVRNGVAVTVVSRFNTNKAKTSKWRPIDN